jgi:hypothetical protein
MLPDRHTRPSFDGARLIEVSTHDLEQPAKGLREALQSARMSGNVAPLRAPPVLMLGPD